MSNSFTVQCGGAHLRGESAGSGPCVIMLHAGVADRRMWRATQTFLASNFRAISYDRRGYGETTSPDEEFRHIDDLSQIIEQMDCSRVNLVGCSQGGRVAIDFALAHPAIVASLILVATAVTGLSPPSDYPAGIRARMAELDAAEGKNDTERVNAIEAHLWLDGPLSAEGRVSGAVRDLFLDMNAKALNNPPLTHEQSCPPAMIQLGRIAAPTYVIWGDRDFPHIQARSREIAGAIPGARTLIMKECAHLPNLEQPAKFQQAIATFLTSMRP